MSIIAIIITIYPLYFVVIASFSSPTAVATGKVILLPKKIQLMAYERVFSYKTIWTGYTNTIFYTVFGTIINISMTLTGAFVLSRKRLMGSRFFMLMIVFTMYFSGGIIPSYFNIRNLGLLDTVWSIVLPGAISPYNLIIACTFMKSTIPETLQEAATIDGCSYIKFYIRIVLPLSSALIGVLALYYAVGHWNSYMSALLYIKDRSKYPLQLILREILVQNKFTAEDMAAAGDPDSSLAFMDLAEGMKYALVVVASVPMLVLYPFLQRFFIKGIMIGSIKE